MLIENILKILQFNAELTINILGALFPGSSSLNTEINRLNRYGPWRFKTDWAEAYRRRQKFYSLLNHMKREGLIKKQGRGKNVPWKITRLGREKLKFLNKRRDDPFSSLNADFKKSSGAGFTIVAFDIPEREKRKRQWIRECLKIMGFKMLQKSVWLSQGRVDEEFIPALSERELMPYVHIFSVNQAGTLKEVE